MLRTNQKIKTTRRSRVKHPPQTPTDTPQEQKKPSRKSRLSRLMPKPTEAKNGQQNKKPKAKARRDPPMKVSEGAVKRSRKRMQEQGITDLSQVDISVRSGKMGREPTEVILARRLVMLDKYVAGKTPDIIAFELGIAQTTVEAEIEAALDLIIAANTKHTPEHQWAKYTVFQLGIIRKLQETFDKIKASGGKMAQAQVSALKEQSTIMDKIVDRGLQFGVIKTPKKKEDGLSEVLGMSPDQIKVLLQQEIKTSFAILDNVDPQQIQTRQKRKLDRGNDLIIEQDKNSLEWAMSKDKQKKLQEANNKDPLQAEADLAKDLEASQETFLVPPTQYKEKDT